MGEIPTTTNKTLGAVESIINGSIMKIGAPIVTKLIQSVPALSFLNIWPLSAILSWGVGFVLQHLSTAFQILGVKLVLNIQTNAELSAYADGEKGLREAMLKGDKDAVQKASDEFDKAAASLIHWDGSSPVIR